MNTLAAGSAIAVFIAALLATSATAEPFDVLTVASRFYASSLRSCRLQTDCASTEYCPEGFPSRRGPALCAPRLAANATCPFRDDGRGNVCDPGHYCGFDPRGGRDRICVPRLSAGASCSRRNDFECKPGLACDGARNSTCRPTKSVGLVGARCFNSRECNAARNLYCDPDTDSCQPRKAAGATCGEGFSDDECTGFCNPKTRFGQAGVCAQGLPAGRLCLEDRQCAGSRAAVPGGDCVVCNGGRSGEAYGFCSPYSQLVKRLGARCNRQRDLCDRERGLQCRWDEARRLHVCQHRFAPLEPGPPRFCRIGHPLSFCPGGADVQCRRTQRWAGPVPVDAPSFPICLPAFEPVAVGARCRAEPARCPRDAQCRPVAGVEVDDPQFPSAVRRVRALFCVRVRAKGEICPGDGGDGKFRAQCDDGLKCERGRCVDAGDAGNEVVMRDAAASANATHVEADGRCERLPCVPGLQCTKPRPDGSSSSSSDGDEEVAKIPVCVLPTVIVPLLAPCGRGSQRVRQCARGLVCTPRPDGGGMRLCRRPFSAGASCFTDEACAGKLRCARKTAPDRGPADRRCYDPETVLPIGAKCKPDAQQESQGAIGGMRCVPDEAAAGRTESSRAVRCLPAQDGHRCQVVANVFESCGEEKDVACDERFRCSARGLCVQR